NGSNAFRHIYHTEKAVRSDAYTVHTNSPTCGAMRAYGIPQITWAMEAHIDDLCAEFGLDPLEVRVKNMMPLGFIDPILGIKCNSTGLAECIEKGRQYIEWDKKREEYKNQTGNIRHGVGMAIFSYKTGVHPIALETAGCRLVMNQDGSVQMQMGATEIGQGADTVFSQMVAEVLSIPMEDVHAVSTQDTDITPFDTGAYASRQSYVSGMAAKKAATELREKVLDYAEYMVNNLPQYSEFKGLTKDLITIVDGVVKSIHSATRNKVIMTLAELATEAQYNLDNAMQLTVDINNQCKSNTFSFGVSFADVTVDIAVGKVTVDKIINVHDCGKLLNPQLAAMQVHGGMSMSIGYGLSEQMLLDRKTGKLLNGNLLDYKLPTTMDTPHLEAQFVEAYDPSAPFGNKSLGEPPAISPAPAIRNAILHATGVSFYEAPMTPQRLVEKFMAEGLIK
ncbi:MAG: molybdopterin cofactor-binding domain-containing protein, partial [Oscillospiraceae bacterium]